MGRLSDRPAPKNVSGPTTDDLLDGLAAPTQLGGQGPYVINLGTSSTPHRIPPQDLLKFEHLHIYQVQRTESDRTRFRLRLGPIASELEADTILAAVREHYPAALTATAGADDLRAIAAAVAAKPAGGPTSQSIEDRPKEVTAAQVPKTPQKRASQTSGKSADATAAAPTLSADTLAWAVRDAHAAKVKTPLEAIDVGSARTISLLDTNVQYVARQSRILREPLTGVDSTQTPRALTTLELAGDQSSQWFVAQLALSEICFRPDNVPNLDIFNEYHLYSVIGLDQGRVMHALRLGFFTDETAAQAVAGYLRCHFEASTAKRVSTAERERFVEGRIAARKDSGPTGAHAVIELSTPPPVAEIRLANLSETANRRMGDEQSLRVRSLAPVKR